MLARSKVLPQLLAGLAADDPDAIAMQDVDGRGRTQPGTRAGRPAPG